MPQITPSRKYGLLLCLASVLGAAVSGPANAQSTSKQPSSVSGSPLDTLLSTRLWTTPPAAQDFVRETRPDPSKLDYTPLTGKDPERPKPRDSANVKALQAELEQGIRANEKRAKALGGVTKPDATAAKRKSANKSARASAR